MRQRRGHHGRRRSEDPEQTQEIRHPATHTWQGEAGGDLGGACVHRMRDSRHRWASTTAPRVAMHAGVPGIPTSRNDIDELRPGDAHKSATGSPRSTQVGVGVSFPAACLGAFCLRGTKRIGYGTRWGLISRI